jgi:branched-chain amino acid transport system ATP-binding protein
MTARTGLDVTGVHAGYGTSIVVRDVTLQVRPGETVALLGPNGAGKTTTMLAIAGVVRPSRGTVALDGIPQNRRSPEKIARSGICLVPQDRGLFRDLTVRENLRLALSTRGGVDDALDMVPELRPLASRRVALLSGGEQQMLAVGRALARRPSILLLDEMSMGLAPRLVERLLQTTVELARRQGLGVLLVEQHVHLALEFADRAAVLVHGRIVRTGSAASMRDNLHELQAEYLGERALT